MKTIGFDMGMGALKLWSKPGGLQLVSQVANNGRAHLADGIVGLKTRKRPILVSGTRAVVGRPPERVLEILAPS